MTIGRTFAHGTPQLLFTENTMALQEYIHGYDVHPDGKRFLMLNAGGEGANQLNLVLNWRAELERLSGGWD